MDIIAFYRIVTAVFVALVGLCVGSFLNVVIYRLPNHMSLATPPSHCTACGYQLRWYDNIPIFSYCFLRGRCRKCRSKISPRYLFVEIANMLLWLLCLAVFGFSDWREAVMTASAAIAGSVCICVAAIDWEHKIIYDRFQLILLVLAIAFTLADAEASVISHIITAVVVLAVLYLIGVLVSKMAGRDAMGGGDIKFAFVTALFLGWQRVLLMWIVASLSALLCIAVKRYKAKKAGDGAEESDVEYPFGPFLAVGFMTALLFGAAIISAYWGLFNPVF